jgi:DNA-binding NarL/FixJ family response regulator
MKDKKISILVANEVSMACDFYAQALNKHARFSVIAQTTTGREAVEAVLQSKIDVALIGASLADGPSSGLLAVKQIRERQPQVKSIVFLDCSNFSFVVASFRAGARGVFDPSRDIAFKQLCKCVEKVNEGQIWATGAELVEVMETFSEQRLPLQIVNADGMQLLTKREEDVVRLIADGLTNRQIALDLKLSEHTIRNNLFRIFDKLGVSTRVELALRAVSCSKQACSAEGNIGAWVFGSGETSMLMDDGKESEALLV